MTSVICFSWWFESGQVFRRRIACTVPAPHHSNSWCLGCFTYASSDRKQTWTCCNDWWLLWRCQFSYKRFYFNLLLLSLLLLFCKRWFAIITIKDGSIMQSISILYSIKVEKHGRLAVPTLCRYSPIIITFPRNIASGKWETTPKVINCFNNSFLPSKRNYQQ